VDHLPRLTRLTWLLSAALWVLLVSSIARADQCPSDIPGWPETADPGGAWYMTGLPVGTNVGGYVNSSAHGTPSGTSSIGAWRSAMVSDLNQYLPTHTWVEVAVAYGANSSWEWVNVIQAGTPTSGGAANQWYGGQIYRAVSSSDSCTAPPPPPDCDSLMNQRFGAISENQNATYSPGDTGCFNGCAAFLKSWTVVNADGSTGNATSTRNRNANGTYNYLNKYQYTGLECTNEPTRTETPTNTPTAPDGIGADKFVESPSGEGCGWVNGKYACYKALQPNKCWVNNDGSRLCAEGAPTPPKPLNADATAPAAPNSTYEVCTGANTCNSYQYFNAATNSAAGQPSSNTGDTENEGPGTGTVGTGPGDSTGDGAGGDSGTGTSGGATWCDTPPTCDGDPVACAQLVQQWRTMCPEEITEAEALEAMGATAGEIDGTDFFKSGGDASSWSSAGPITAGSCPAPVNVSIMGQSLSLDIWQRGCDMALLFAPFVMVMAYLMGAVLLFRSNW